MRLLRFRVLIIKIMLPGKCYYICKWEGFSYVLVDFNLFATFIFLGSNKFIEFFLHHYCTDNMAPTSGCSLGEGPVLGPATLV